MCSQSRGKGGSVVLPSLKQSHMTVASSPMPRPPAHSTRTHLILPRLLATGSTVQSCPEAILPAAQAGRCLSTLEPETPGGVDHQAGRVGGFMPPVSHGMAC